MAFSFFRTHLGRAIRGVSWTSAALAAGLVIVAASVAPVAARQAGGGGAGGGETKTLLALDFAGASSALVSEKDAALAQAVAMLPARIEELRGQSQEFAQVPRAATDMLIAALSHPIRFAVTDKGFDPDTGMPGIGATLSFQMGNDQAAGAMARSFDEIRKVAFSQTPVSASARFAGMTELPLPMGVLTYGPRKARDGARFEVIFGAVNDPDAVFGGLPAPGRITRPVFRGVLDLAAMTPMTQMLAGFLSMAGGPGGASIVGNLKKTGMMGPEAVAYEVTKGYTAESGEVNLRIRRMARFAEANSLSTIPLSASDLAAIPADATTAFVTKTPLAHTLARLRAEIDAAAPGQMDAALAELNSMLGVDLEQDIIASLGDTIAVYTSDTTGGGSILSGVALVALAQPERMAGAMERLAGKFNETVTGQFPAPGALRIEAFAQGGIKFTQLRVRGLPFPLEPTIAIADRWLVIGATPSATIAAAQVALGARAGGGGGGLAANPAFARYRWKTSEPTSVFFIDTQRTMRTGYPLLSFATSAISNAMRSSAADVPAREVGFILPTYAELSKDARPVLALSYWEGEDMVMEARWDRSILVFLAGILGAGDLGQIVGSALVGGGVGAAISHEMGGASKPMREPRFDADDDDDDDAQGAADGDEKDPQPRRRARPN